MRYLLVDLDGNQRGAFSSRTELIEDLEETAAESPDLLTTLFVQEFEGEEMVGRACRADEMIGAVVNLRLLTALASAVVAMGHYSASTETHTVQLPTMPLRARSRRSRSAVPV